MKANRNWLLTAELAVLVLVGACRSPRVEPAAEGAPEQRGGTVVEAEWILNQAKGADGHSFRVVEVVGHGKAVPRYHIPGAVLLRTDDIERAPLWNLIDDAELEALLGARGIRWNVPVLVYGSDDLAVARVVWMLLYAGVEEVRWLAGGLGAWKRAGEPLAAEREQPEAQMFGLKVPGHPEYRATTDDVRRAVSARNHDIVSVRSRAEYDGRTSGYHYIQEKGHIPSAIWGTDAGRWSVSSWAKLLRAMDEQWSSAGITPETPTIFYCGTGWRSSLAFLVARDLGYDEVSSYDGSWLEWSRREASEPAGGADE